jgi:tRNA dimethylallyltransferase
LTVGALLPPRPWAALVGPTASGKSEAGIAVAERLDAEIVSVDSMLVYRGMDVGTDKPSRSDRARVTHHLLDVTDPDRPFSAARFQHMAGAALAGIAARSRKVVLVGGSGLYFRALVDQLDLPPTNPATRASLEAEAAAVGAGRLYERLRSFDPAAASRIQPGNARRTIRALEVAALTGRPFSTFSAAWERYPSDRVRAAGVTIPPNAHRRRMETRVRTMLDQGWLDEVRALLDRGLGSLLTARQAIGYAELVEHLSGAISLDEAVTRTVKRTRALARRQLAWFRRDPRIRWFEADGRGAVAVSEEIGEYLAVG